MSTPLLVLLFAVAFLLPLLLFWQSRRKLAQLRQQHREDGLNLRYLLNVRSAIADERHYRGSAGNERVIYDGRTVLHQNDFTGGAAQDWNYVQHRFAQGTGEGKHEVANNGIAIIRTNTDGRYELHLNRYLAEGKELDHLPATPEKRVRCLHLSCEVRRHEAPHLLRFVWKGETSKNMLDEKETVVFNTDWEPVNLNFWIATNEASRLRIDDLDVLTAPSSIEVRNILLVEKDVEGC